MTRPKTVTALAPDPCKITAAEKIIGALVIFFFVATWISSLLSPLILANALYKGYYIRSGLILLITLVSYASWEKGPVAKAVHQVVYKYFPLYFKSFALEFEGNDDPSSANSKPSQQTFYAIHPHGAFSFGWSALFCHMEQVRFCFAPPLYASPFFRLFSRCVGNPGSADKAAMIRYMKAGENLALPPGGFEEATLTCPDQDRVYIQKRTGFVKLCLQHGIAIRPVYVFGESKLYWNIQGAWDFRIKTINQKLGLPAIVTWGHSLVPLLPRNTVDMKIVVGAPLVLPRIENPSKDQVATWHAKYVAALTKVYEEHKEGAYGPEVAKTSKLQLW
jgi:Diacylglycerol acyltransferase